MFFCPRVDSKYINSSNWSQHAVFGLRNGYSPLGTGAGKIYTQKKVKKPSRFILSSDTYFTPANYGDFKSSYMLYSGNAANHAMAFWHHGRTVAGVLDGHVIHPDRNALRAFKDEKSWGYANVDQMIVWWQGEPAPAAASPSRAL